MYPLALLLHSWLRWVVLLLGIVAVVRAWKGRGGAPWTPADDSWSRLFVVSLDVQFLIGLLLYAALSPITQIAFANFGAAMRSAMLRFWAVEHLFGMVVAIALAHVGRVRIGKATSDRQRHQVAAMFFGFALLVLLLSIPWPGMPAGRQLFRGF